MYQMSPGKTAGQNLPGMTHQDHFNHLQQLVTLVTSAVAILSLIASGVQAGTAKAGLTKRDHCQEGQARQDPSIAIAWLSNKILSWASCPQGHYSQIL